MYPKRVEAVVYPTLLHAPRHVCTLGAPTCVHRIAQCIKFSASHVFRPDHPVKTRNAGLRDGNPVDALPTPKLDLALLLCVHFGGLRDTQRSEERRVGKE